MSAPTAEGIAVAAFFNAGQDCTAATRVLVGPQVHTDFLDALVEQARGTVVGPFGQDDANYGPLNNVNQLERVQGFLERVPAHAQVLTGGERVGERGYCFAPTVVAGLRQEDEMIQQEVFRAGYNRADGSRTKPKRWSGQTGSSTGLPPVFGHATTDGPCAWPGTSISVAFG